MKKVKFLSLALAAMCALFMVSCDDNDTTIRENDIPDGTHTVNFSIQVIPSSLNARVAGLTDVQVTVSQNGVTLTKKTTETGIVTFDKLKLGPVSIYVKSPAGFLSVNGTYSLGCSACQYQDSDSEQTEYEQLTITLPRLGATVRGRILADADFNGTLANGETLPTTATVIARIDQDFEPNVFKTNPAADGTFSFTNLPEGVEVDFYLDFKKIDTTPNPTVERSFSFDTQSGTLTATPDINNPFVFGNVIAVY